METENPELKIGEELLKGKVEPILGTSLVFKTPPAGSTGARGHALVCSFIRDGY